MFLLENLFKSANGDDTFMFKLYIQGEKTKLVMYNIHDINEIKSVTGDDISEDDPSPLIPIKKYSLIISYQ